VYFKVDLEFGGHRTEVSWRQVVALAMSVLGHILKPKDWQVLINDVFTQI
jgi:hypothetical protein